jgi:hypothetical protein
MLPHLMHLPRELPNQSGCQHSRIHNSSYGDHVWVDWLSGVGPAD